MCGFPSYPHPLPNMRRSSPRCRLRAVSVLAFAFSLLVAHPARAQLTRADSAAVLLATAETFDGQGQPDVASALYRFILEHFGATPAAEVARGRIRVQQVQGTPGSGRVELMVWSTLYGLWVGVAIPSALDVQDDEPYGAGLLLGGPAGFFIGRGMANSLNPSMGQARAITWGGTWGTWQGAGWAGVADMEYPGAVAMTLVGGLVGSGIGYALAHDPVSESAATGANYGSLWGSWFGVALAVLADVNDGDAVLSTTLIAGNAGLIIGAIAAPRAGWSRSRIRMTSVAGVAGLMGGWGVDILADVNGDQSIMVAPLAMSILGLVIGGAATKDMDAVGGEATGSRGDYALLNRVGGRWSAGSPMPMPALLPVDRPDRTAWEPAVKLNLFRWTF